MSAPWKPRRDRCCRCRRSAFRTHPSSSRVPIPDEGRATLREVARISGGTERTAWDDVFSTRGLRNRQVRDLVIPLALILLLPAPRGNRRPPAAAVRRGACVAALACAVARDPWRALCRVCESLDPHARVRNTRLQPRRQRRWPRRRPIPRPSRARWPAPNRRRRLASSGDAK